MLNYVGMIVFLFSQIMTIKVVFDLGKKPLQSLIIGMLIWETVLFIATEGLSIARLISFPAILLFWLVYSFILFLQIRRNNCSDGRRFIKRTHFSVGRLEKCLTGIIILIASVQLFFSCVTVPYNYDSMTYHLPRILIWIQNHCVNYYDTDIIRQNVSPVLAEFNNLHWMLLCGSDQLANLVQYKAFLFNAVLIWGILDLLDCRHLWKLISILLYMTMSITLAESISTQTDLFACCWLLCTVFLALAVYRKEHLTKSRRDFLDMFALAVSVGLTYLAKANLCIASMILIVWLLLGRFAKKDSMKLLLSYTAFCGIVILGMALPTWIRNFRFAGDILASDYMGMIAIGSYEPRLVLMNIFKNIGDLAVLPYTGTYWMIIGEKLSRVLGVNLNDPAISFAGSQFVIHYSQNMDLAGAPAAVLLSLSVLLYSLICRIGGRRLSKTKGDDSFLACLLLSVFLTLIITRWQPWGSRLMIHACIMLILVSGFLLDRHDRYKPILKGGFAVLWMLLVVFTVCNTALAWQYHGRIALEGVGCTEQERFRLYFRENPQAWDDYSALCKYLEQNRSIGTVGFFTSSSGYEYPLMKELIKNDITFAAVTLSDDSMERGLNDGYVPDVIISIDTGISTDATYWCSEKPYTYIEIAGSSNSKYLLYQLK